MHLGRIRMALSHKGRHTRLRADAIFFTPQKVGIKAVEVVSYRYGICDPVHMHPMGGFCRCWSSSKLVAEATLRRRRVREGTGCSPKPAGDLVGNGFRENLPWRWNAFPSCRFQIPLPHSTKLFW